MEKYIIIDEIFKFYNFQSSFFFNPFIIGFGLILIGFFGLIFSKKNIIILLMNLELIFLGIGLNYIAYVLLTFSIFSYSFAFFLLAFAAAEAAVGLGLIVNLFSLNKTLTLFKLIKVRG